MLWVFRQIVTNWRVPRCGLVTNCSKMPIIFLLTTWTTSWSTSTWEACTWSLLSICCLTITFIGFRIVGPKFAFYQFLTFFLTTGYIIDVIHIINLITNIISCQKTLIWNQNYKYLPLLNCIQMATPLALIPRINYLGINSCHLQLAIFR